MRAQTSVPRRRRAPWIALLVLCSFWIGLVAGTAVGARFLVPAGSGLAGPAIALGYGVAGALAAAVLVGVLGRRLPARSLRRSAVVALLLAVLAALVVGYRFVTQQAERRAQAGLDAGTLQHFRLDPRCAARLS
jgi:nitrate reductase gamma subunit